MHKLHEQTVITPLLLQRFAAEADHDGGDGRFYAIAQLDDGMFVEHGQGPDPDTMQVIFGRDMLNFLNTHLHHDGAWVFMLTHPGPVNIPETQSGYNRFVFMWMDADGDIQFPFDWIANNNTDFRDFSDCLLAGHHKWAEFCEEAWQTWKWTVQALDLKPEQQIKRAKGQRYTQAEVPEGATIQ